MILEVRLMYNQVCFSMKPKTKLQNIVTDLSKELVPITEEQKNWGYENCLDSFVAQSRKTYYCLECAHSWKDDSPILHNEKLDCTCEKCSAQLKLMKYTSTNYSDIAYMTVLDTIKGFQVVRIVFLKKSMKKKEASTCFGKEVMQHWISPEGTITSMSLNVQGMSRYYDQWIFSSEMSVKPNSFQQDSKFTIEGFKTYPKRKISARIKRNGFKNSFYGLIPQKLFSALLNDSKAETLLKAGQIPLLKARIDSKYNKIDDYWSSIKICIRNSYKVKSYSTWVDYLNFLEYFGKDIRSPKYVCSLNMFYEHDKLVEKKRILQQKIDLELQRERIEEYQIKYAQEKAKYFGLQFKNENLTISVIEYVQDFMIAGDELNHCVFTNECYAKEHSLLLSAKVNEVLCETIEISLDSFRILQARGFKNKPTKHNAKIKKLIYSNMNIIKEASKKAS